MKLKSKSELIDLGSDLVEKTEKAGAVHAEAFMLHYDYFILRYAASRLMEAKSDCVLGTRLRVILDEGRMGSASTTELSAKGIDQVIEDAVAVAHSSRPTHYRAFPEPTKLKTESLAPRLSYSSVRQMMKEPESAIEHVNLQIDTALDQHKTIDNVSGSNALYDETYAVVSSQGMALGASGTKFSVAHTTHLEGPSGAEPVSGYSWFDSRDATSFDPEAVAIESADMALASAEPIMIDEGKFDVIWNPYTWSEMLSYVLGRAITCRSVQDGVSFYADKVGEKVADETLGLVDNPHDPTGLFSAPFDDEGTPTEEMPLIKEGILHNFLADSFFATRDVSVAKPNGHAFRRFNYIHTLADPMPTPSNLELRGTETTDLDKLIEDVKHGLIVSRIWYTYPVSPIIGDFTGNLRSGMFMIENGEITRPIRQKRFFDNFPEMLQRVDGIANNSRQVTPWFGVNVTAPSILTRDVKFVA